jgi:bacteriorhodopsin
MNFPDTHSTWMWLYFGVFGTAGIAMFALAMWNLAKLRKQSDQRLAKAIRHNMIGYMFLFTASWFACGIGGPPGNLLSADPATHNQFAALAAAAAGMFFSVPGWTFLFLGSRSALKALDNQS